MERVILLIITACAFFSEGYSTDLTDVLFEPPTSTFALDSNSTPGNSDPIYFATASNADIYSLESHLGVFKKRLTFNGDKEVSGESIHASVHAFNSEVDEKSKTIHFVCHVIALEAYRSTKSSPSSTCCVISLNTSFSHEYTSCIVDLTSDKLVSVCHAQARLPTVLWKQKNSPVISLSYTFFKTNPSLYSHNKDNECHMTNSVESPVFHLLPPATVVRSVPDAIRELGRSLLLQIPRRELKTNEEFIVPVRLKRGDDVSDFTLRCEIPSNSYVEFVRVIWPGGLSSGKHGPVEFGAVAAHPILPESVRSDANPVGSGVNGNAGLQNVWDVFHRTILSPKRNVTEIVARFREDLARAAHAAKHTPATEVYKLLFRVNQPAAGSPGRVAPRIFWSLISLSRRNSPDRTAGGSPIVTRLNIESSELKHLAMVLKTSALVNLAALTGQPALYPVWVYGLTHDRRLIDVTARATCHSGDDAVIHFASDDCRKLGFSGAELDGSPGLPLVAKLDGRSATATLLVWFPKSPAFRLVVDGEESTRTVGPHTPLVVLKRFSAGPVSMSPAYGVPSWPFTDNQNGHNSSGISTNRNHLVPQVSYQFARIRVLARFILAGSVLYDKDVFGGKNDQYVDVTDFTAHRIRLEEMDWLDAAGGMGLGSTHVGRSEGTVSSRLLLIDRAPQDSTEEMIDRTWATMANQTQRKSICAWLMGQRAGRMRVRLAPIDRAKLKANIPPGLVKQLKDQKSELVDPTDIDSFGDDSLWAGTVKDEPYLDLVVRDEPGTWPVGISAQIVTDFSMSLSQVTDHENSMSSAQSAKLPNARYTATGDSNVYAGDHLMPLYSGLYALQFTLHGGKLAHSGAVATNFHEVLRRTTQAYTIPHGRPIELRNRSQADGLLTADQNTGLILVWIHMSDGTSILWNRLKEISEASGQALPFKLALDNLRPDLFSIREQGIEPVVKRQKRSASSWWSPHGRIAERFTVQHDFHTSMADPSTAASLGAIKHSRGPWTGPSIRYMRPGVSYSGEVLEVGLSSPNDQVLVPRTRVQVKFLMPVTDAGSSAPEHIGQSRTGYAPNGQNSILSPSDPRLASSNHGYLALKDAPGFRNLPLDQQKHLLDQSPRKLIKGDQLHETSLSDQRGDEKAGTGSDALDDNSGDGKPSRSSAVGTSGSAPGSGSLPSSESDASGASGHGSRPALEMSMYILLGLFALVGLVLAVNCGAVVARYRWERIGRRRSAAQAEMEQATEEAIDPAQSNQPECGTQGQNRTSGHGSVNEAKNEHVEQNSLRRYSKLLLPFRNKNKPLLHRDTNWVWIGRDKVGENQTETNDAPTPSPMGHRHRSANSPLLDMTDEVPKGVASARSSRGATGSNSRKPTNPNSNTTAVLSVGEADMLLMHSPYHQDAWQDTLRSTKQGCDEQSVFPHAWPYPGSSGTTQDSRGMSTASATVGRPARRHTTGVLMQRNYQGQECSIRIISNPMSQSASSPQDGMESSDSTTHDHDERLQALQTSHSWAVCHPVDTNQAPYDGRLGSASASVSRKHRARPGWIGGPVLSEYDQRERNDTVDGFDRSKKANPGDWAQGIGPYLSPWMMMPPIMPPPNQPAPPVPYGHLRPQDAAYYWEAVMYRSWVRPRTGWKCPEPGSEANPANQTVNPPCQANSPWNVRTRRSLGNAVGTPGTTARMRDTNATRAGQLEQARAAHMLKTLRESREHTFERHSEEFGSPNCPAPFPPVRTTSRTVDSHTLEANKARRKLSLDANPRPLSLPQNFQATNELYGAFTGDSSELGDASTEYGPSGVEKEPLPGSARSTVASETCPSEESLWWYHPVRRRRKRRHEQQNPPSSHHHSQHPNLHQPNNPGIERKDAPREISATNKPLLCNAIEPIEYACPAPCDCDQRVFKAPQPDGKLAPCIPGTKATGAPTETRTALPTALLHASTLTSLSDVAWDRDLLALSHDRLVAYFAGMKESNA